MANYSLSLILNFLRDRTQVTKVVCCICQSVSLPSGVVQGSPLLFLIFINDLVTVFNTNVTPKLHADDSRLFEACHVQPQLQTFRKILTN